MSTTTKEQKQRQHNTQTNRAILKHKHMQTIQTIKADPVKPQKHNQGVKHTI